MSLSPAAGAGGGDSESAVPARPLRPASGSAEDADSDRVTRRETCASDTASGPLRLLPVVAVAEDIFQVARVTARAGRLLGSLVIHRHLPLHGIAIPVRLGTGTHAKVPRPGDSDLQAALHAVPVPHAAERVHVALDRRRVSPAEALAAGLNAAHERPRSDL